METLIKLSKSCSTSMDCFWRHGHFFTKNLMKTGLFCCRKSIAGCHLEGPEWKPVSWKQSLSATWRMRRSALMTLLGPRCLSIEKGEKSATPSKCGPFLIHFVSWLRTLVWATTSLVWRCVTPTTYSIDGSRMWLSLLHTAWATRSIDYG